MSAQIPAAAAIATPRPISRGTPAMTPATATAAAAAATATNAPRGRASAAVTAAASTAGARSAAPRSASYAVATCLERVEALIDGGRELGVGGRGGGALLEVGLEIEHAAPQRRHRLDRSEPGAVHGGSRA